MDDDSILGRDKDGTLNENIVNGAMQMERTHIMIWMN